jgi:NADH:ubiquinone oxidoreductase subunit C
MVVTPVAVEHLAAKLQEAVVDSVERWNEAAVWVKPTLIDRVCRFLREDPDLDFQFLNSISAVDFIEYFELSYHLTSMQRHHTALVKTRVFGRENLTVPSVYGVWRGADFQEREIWDLMGIHFEGHPNMKRIMLWEGFPGHPLRKDYL